MPLLCFCYASAIPLLCLRYASAMPLLCLPIGSFSPRSVSTVDSVGGRSARASSSPRFLRRLRAGPTAQQDPVGRSLLHGADMDPSAHDQPSARGRARHPAAAALAHVPGPLRWYGRDGAGAQDQLRRLPLPAAPAALGAPLILPRDRTDVHRLLHVEPPAHRHSLLLRVPRVRRSASLAPPLSSLSFHTLSSSLLRSLIHSGPLASLDLSSTGTPPSTRPPPSSSSPLVFEPTICT